MALLFSSVTLTANEHDAEFLVSGIPRDTDDLEGWTAYEGFLGEIDEECEVSVHVEAYLYGEGETFQASLRHPLKKLPTSPSGWSRMQISSLTAVTTSRMPISLFRGHRKSSLDWR